MTAPTIEAAPQLSDEIRCQRRRWSGELLCSMPGHLVAAVCVHEHIVERRYCAAHVGAVNDGDLTLACVQCRLSTQPHNCPVRLITKLRDVS